MEVPKISIDLNAYFKDRYWHGWWWDRICLYDHAYNIDCKDCKNGTWYYTAPKKTSMKFGLPLNDHELYVKYMRKTEFIYLKSQIPRGRKK